MPVKYLINAETSALIDRTASAEWGLNPFALVEAAGRNMADKLAAFLGAAPWSTPIVAFIGSGNNGADAMVMLKTLILNHRAHPSNCRLVLNRIPAGTEQTPRSETFKTLAKMNVQFSDFATWKNTPCNKNVGIIIDGIAGTGLKGQLAGTAMEMAREINEAKRKASVTVASIDVPSGLFDEWSADMPIVNADITLAVEPRKLCLYKPSARVSAGNIVSIGGVFPQGLLDAFANKENVELFTWETAKTQIPKIAPDVHKYQRGLAEIHAGCVGSAGAARIAAAGAQAVGAGLTRLLVDETLYPILASAANGIMVAIETNQDDRWKPDAVLLGSGWGNTADRPALFEKTLARATANAATVVLDADAIPLLQTANLSPVHGTILTPHVGEFVKFAHISKETALSNPVPILKRIAKETRAVILFKSHVLIIADADGRIGVIDGMMPVLAAGGSGDLLAGMTAGLAARRVASPFMCAVVAASLLVESGKAMNTFADPLELAETVSKLAFEAWVDRDGA
jgi:NAD(P)H-hydrate epimerase